jgi:hypothetical protein
VQREIPPDMMMRILGSWGFAWTVSNPELADCGIIAVGSSTRGFIGATCTRILAVASSRRRQDSNYQQPHYTFNVSLLPAENTLNVRISLSFDQQRIGVVDRDRL